MLEDRLPIIIIMVLCLVMSAYFSATETAFSSMSRTRVRTLAEKGKKKAKKQKTIESASLFDNNE